MVLYFSHGAPAFFSCREEEEKTSAGSGELLQNSSCFLFIFFVLDERKKVLLRAEQKTASPSEQALRDVQNAAHTSCCCQQTW